jgi:CAAX protease family protein
MSNESAGLPVNGDALHGALPYVLPFVLFLAFLASNRYAPGAWVEAMYAAGFFVVLTAAFICSRHIVTWRLVNFWGSAALGVALFVVWVGPDLLWPAYRESWLFHNGIVGAPKSSLPAGVKASVRFMTFRVLSSTVNVPVLEELFWRGWLMRWLISSDFRKVPLGTYSAQSFWLVAVLFATEHGPYWDVGLIAGVVFNWWMTRTRSLADCIVLHAVTNGCLAAYVLIRNQWQYWL